MHKDISGTVQSDRKGLGKQNFKPFCKSSEKERRDAVVEKMRQRERERRNVHLVQCTQQGQYVRWEEQVVERKLSWRSCGRESRSV